MTTSGRASPSSWRGFAAVAVALAGLGLAFTPWLERAENALLDAQWWVLRKFDARPAPPDIVIVGIDERTARGIPAPQGMWHEALGKALLRIAAAKPKAIVIDLPLPERSYDEVRPGVDRALLVGLAAARHNGPLVATLSIDARTRAARPIHAPYLALLGEERLGLGLVARDIDGVTRRYSLAIPTEDGAFPTLAGRVCRALSRSCADGLLHFALGEPHRYVPLQRVLEAADAATLDSLFRGRIVLLGEIQRFGNRIAVPANLAGWESEASDTPSVVVQAQSIRTALLQAAPQEASKAPIALLVSLAALLVLVRDPRLALVTGALAALAVFVVATLALRGGLYLPVAAALVTLGLAWAARAAWAFSCVFELRRRH